MVGVQRVLDCLQFFQGLGLQTLCVGRLQTNAVGRVNLDSERWQTGKLREELFERILERRVARRKGRGVRRCFALSF